jgi:hypothetical protein
MPEVVDQSETIPVTLNVTRVAVRVAGRKPVSLALLSTAAKATFIAFTVNCNCL